MLLANLCPRCIEQFAAQFLNILQNYPILYGCLEKKLRAENIVWKREKARNQHFLLFPMYFSHVN